MRGVVMHAPGDVRVEDRPDPAIEQPTGAVIKVSAACVCGSDLWPYRGVEKLVGREVTTIRPGQFVVGSFWASDSTCEVCRAGYQSGCVHRVLMGTIGTQAQYARIPPADGTLVATSSLPDQDLIPQLPGRLGRTRHRLVRSR